MGDLVPVQETGVMGIDMGGSDSFLSVAEKSG